MRALFVSGERDMVEITAVGRDSPASRAGVLPGDYLISVDGHDVNDVLDYRFYLTPRAVTLKIHRGPELFDVKVYKEEYADIGLEFSSYMMDESRTCRNKCIFCFIDQMPPGMRDTLYFKDDDSRMSFLTGSYITLTNLSDGDVDRIIAMKMSPVNVSVHTTDPELRCRMMNNRFAGESLKYLRRMAEAGIELHCQIVLCRGINDGGELERSLRDLTDLAPAVRSVSVVPAGLTRYRDGLYPLTPFTPEECKKVIDQVDAARERCLREHGSAVFCCSDEFFLKAGIPIPDADYYEDYPQLENGVGMIRSMGDEFRRAVEFADEDYDLSAVRKCSVATGYAAYGFIRSLADELMRLSPSLDIRVYRIENKFFGPEITVAGLVTGGDLIEQLRGKELGDTLYIPSVMLRYENDLFLDGVSTDDVERELGVRLVWLNNDGYEFVDAVLGLRDPDNQRHGE